MATPKGKVSKARRNSRRANWKLSLPGIVKCPKCGKMKLRFDDDVAAEFLTELCGVVGHIFRIEILALLDHRADHVCLAALCDLLFDEIICRRATFRKRARLSL